MSLVGSVTTTSATVTWSSQTKYRSALTLVDCKAYQRSLHVRYPPSHAIANTTSLMAS
ncbi:hypothetical protein Mapa_013668 [Marchantia paleacea]|nr:hypothetical protein Mapa_013668 [Marchantia paleacea]